MRRRPWLGLLVPLALGTILALAWVRVTGGTTLAATLRGSNPVTGTIMVGVTGGWLFLRFVRWQFLLRRAGIRLPIRPSLTRYLAGLPGTATPAYVGELLRAVFLRRDFQVPVRVTAAILVLERLFDVAALALLAMASGSRLGLRLGVVFLAIAGALAALLWPVFRRVGIGAPALERLRAPKAVLASLLLSLAAWAAAGGLYYLGGRALGFPVPLSAGVSVFATSTLLGAVTLVPAGLGVTGSVAIVQLTNAGFALSQAVSLVTLVRLSSTGVALGLGMIFLWREIRRGRAPRGTTDHFTSIAEEYRSQWTPHVWNLLLERRLAFTVAALPSPPERAGRGVDLGCGLGIQTSEMRRRGFQVFGVEPSVGLLRQGRSEDLSVLAGDALALPFQDRSVDFLFTIGVLHHLPGRESQTAALAEIRRVLKPGGRFIVHESNPRNPLFRFYMGYLFPMLKSIDEGTEWWIDPRHWEGVPGLRLADTRYFTFLPDFTPRILMRPALWLEQLLERGPTRAYSAHYMAVMVREGSPTTPEMAS